MLSKLTKLERLSILSVIFLSFIVSMQNISVPGMHMDGTIYAVLGKNAAQHGHWLVPHLAPKYLPKFFEHPPFFFMWEGILFKLFGVTWSVARFSGALFFPLSVIALILFLLRLNRTKLAFYAGLALSLAYPAIKKARYPNLDIPLMLFFSTSLYAAYLALEEKNKNWWIVSGIAFGGALLTKGFPALFIPFTLLVLMILRKDFTPLKQPLPWIGLGLGFLMFSLWPLLLFQAGEFEGFKTWIGNQFGATVIEGRDAQTLNPFFYFWYLIKYNPPFGTLAIIYFFFLAKRYLQKSSDSLEVFSMAFFIGVLLPLSLMKWKFSHYMMPVYPAIALVSGQLLFKIKDKFHINTQKVISVLVGVTFLVFLFLPAKKIKRNRELILSYQKIESLKLNPTGYYNDSEALPNWAFVATLRFVQDAPVHTYDNPGKIMNDIPAGAILFSTRDWSKQRTKSFKKIMEFPQKGLKVFHLEN